jgi:porphobilinogen synthase
LIYPVFVVSGEKRREPIQSMPGVERMSVDLLQRACSQWRSTAVLIFGVVETEDKNPEGTAACEETGLVSKAV